MTTDYFIEVNWGKLQEDVAAYCNRREENVRELAQRVNVPFMGLLALVQSAKPIPVSSTILVLSAMGRPLDRYVTVKDDLLKTASSQVPPGVSHGQPDINRLVHQDLMARGIKGAKKYGVPLRPFNGRSALVDAYQEAMDQVLYLRQAIEEQSDVSTFDGFQQAACAQWDEAQGLSDSAVNLIHRAAALMYAIHMDPDFAGDDQVEAVKLNAGQILWNLAILTNEFELDLSTVVREQLKRVDAIQNHSQEVEERPDDRKNQDAEDVDEDE